MARLYSDENFPYPVVEELRQLAHDVLTIQQTGRSGEGVKDEEILNFAIQERRAVLTLNRADFKRLHRTHPEHSGIIVCTVDHDVVRQAARIHDAIKQLATLDNMLIRVNRPVK